MEIKKDRRVRKSKESLKNSLIELMKEKPFNNITVKELVLKADLNRSTFYNYYCDIPDMLSKLEEELYNEFLRTIELHICKTDKRPELSKKAHDFIEDMCDVIKNNYELCKCIFSKNGDINFLFKLEELVEKHLKKQVEEIYDGNIGKFSYEYSFFKSGYIGILETWMKGGCKESSQEIADLTYKLIKNVIINC